jgi:hypothetical protein
MNNEIVENNSSFDLTMDDVFEPSKTQDYVNNNQQTFSATYAKNYQILKTVLMILAWLILGINIEIINNSIGELKILLNVKYENIAFFKSIGYITMSLVIGFILEKIINYSESLMAAASFLIVIRTYIFWYFKFYKRKYILVVFLAVFCLPWIHYYGISISFFLIQGLAQGLFEVTGYQIIFRLWNDVIKSSINTLYAGYGIGAVIIIHVLEPFKQVIIYKNQLSNETNITVEKFIGKIHSSDIKLHIPYTIAGCLGTVMLISFLAAQYFETQNNERQKELYKNKKSLDKDNNDRNLFLISKENFYREKTFFYKIIQLALLVALFISISGFLTTLNSFFFMYLSKGQSGISNMWVIGTFFNFKTIYWLFYSFGGLAAALLAYKINSLILFLFLISTNTSLSILFVIPLFNTNHFFYYFFVSAFGFFIGPIIPSTFMVAKHVLIDLQSVFISLFCVGIGIGALISHYLFEIFIDYTNSTYIFPLYLFGWVLLSDLIFAIILFIHKFYNNLETNQK